MRPRRLLLGLPASLSAGRRRPALAMALVFGLGLSPMVGASGLDPGVATAGGLAAPRPIEPDPRVLEAPLPEPFGITSRVSERPGGGDAAGPSAEASISANGRYVAFSSLAPDLAAGDTNDALDVFVRDRVTGETVRLPVIGSEPGAPGGRASDPAISPDGGFVAFTYLRPAVSNPTLVAVPAQPLVMLWDAGSGTSRVVSLDRNGRPAFGSTEPAVSDGGRYVAYTSLNPNITSGDSNKQTDVFRVDTGTGATTMVSRTPSGTSPRGSSRSPAISVDGDIVAFTSNAPNVLIPDPTPTPTPTPTPSPTPTSSDDIIFLGAVPRGIVAGVGVGWGDRHPSGGQHPPAQASAFIDQVYARNVSAGLTELISQTPTGAAGSGSSGSPAISADGTVVAFVSFGTDLAPGDADSAGDIYVRERSFGRTSLLTADLPDAGQVAISGDGRIVVFSSATGAGGEGVEVYHRDRFSGETIHISVALGGGDGGANNLGPVVSSEGRVVAWASTSAVLIAADGNGLGDVFVRELPPAGTIDPPVLDFGTRALGTTAPPGAATLTSVGWTPLGSIAATIVGGNAADFSLVDGCTGVVLPRSQSCTVTVLFSPQDVGPRSSTLQVTDNGFGSPHTVRLIGAGSNAVLTLDPPNGPPGIVTIAEGKGFPANITVSLVWSVGINERRAPVVTDAAGSFRAQVLVFHHDVEGPRDLVASPADGKAFRPISVAFFVSTPTNSPPGFDPTGLGSLPRGWFLR